MVYILLGNGFEEIEALTPCDLLRRAGIELALVGVNGIEIVGSHKIVVRADLPLDAVHVESTDMLILPGGLKGVQSILDCRAALELVKRAWEASWDPLPRYAIPARKRKWAAPRSVMQMWCGTAS